MSSASSKAAVAAVNVLGPINADASSEYVSPGSHSDSEDAPLLPIRVRKRGQGRKGKWQLTRTISAPRALRQGRSACRSRA